MGNLFGRKKPSSSVTQHDRAVLQLKHQRDELKKYQRRIEAQMGRDRQAAKQLLADGRKERALLMLRKRKRQETLLQKADNQLDQLEQLTQDIEFAQVQSQVVAGLEAGNKALKELNSFLSLERVESVMDETQEAVEYQRQIDALLSGQLTDEEETACEDELEQLLADAEAVPALPDAPTDVLPQQQEEGEGQKQKRSKAAAGGETRQAVPAS